MADIITKKVVDTGEIGNASTGDILYDGGVKINQNFKAIFDSFGDQRLNTTSDGANQQVIHATGYFQHGTSSDFISPIPNGSQYDIDTSNGSINLRLTKGKRGELVRFSNSNGSFSVNNPLIIVANDSFKGISGPLYITSPYSIVECWCISDSSGVSVWDYSIDNMFGDKINPVNMTVELSTTNKDIQVCHKTEYNTVKLLMTAVASNNKKMKSSEQNILIDPVNNLIYNTEFASLRIGAENEDDEIYDCSFSINNQGYVIASVKTNLAGMKLSIKTIATQKIGVAD